MFSSGICIHNQCEFSILVVSTNHPCHSKNDKNNHLQTLSSSEKETTHAFLSANDGDDKNKLLNKHCAQFKFTETHRHSAEMTSVWPRINSIPPPSPLNSSIQLRVMSQSELVTHFMYNATVPFAIALAFRNIHKLKTIHALRYPL